MAPKPSRDGHGDYTRNIDTVERDAEAARLRARDHTFQEIADQLGFAGRNGARYAVERALASAIAEPAEELRRLELMKLDAMSRSAWEVLEAQHYLVSQGRVIHLGDGEPLGDDAPVLHAIDRLLKISERRCKLLGIDAPVRMEVTSIDALDQQIAALEAELAERAAVGEDASAEGASGS